MISIAIPTYKRLAFLKRAVEDVFAQSWTDWELVISDDEEGESAETWLWLKELAAKDARVRVLKNCRGRHGQAWNLNNALLNCRGEWIKPFFDDDRMLPNCLERMMETVGQYPSAVLIGCRAQKWREGRYAGDEKDFSGNRTQVIAQANAQRAICLFDRWNGRTPQHMMLRRSVVKKGALMPETDRYRTPVDWVWFASILAQGDYVMMPDVLVCQCEGEVASVTAAARADETKLDQELFAAYKDIYEMLPAAVRGHLSWRDIASEINGIRGIYHLKCRRVALGLKMIAKMFLSLRGPLLSLRWLLQESFPAHFPATPRSILSPRSPHLHGHSQLSKL